MRRDRLFFNRDRPLCHLCCVPKLNVPRNYRLATSTVTLLGFLWRTTFHNAMKEISLRDSDSFLTSFKIIFDRGNFPRARRGGSTRY
jgi:hypothetical protein